MTVQSVSSREILIEYLTGSSEGAALFLKRAALVIIGAAAIAIASKARIPMWPVPVTLQTFAVLTIGAAYGPRLGPASVLLWLGLGAAGLNVFASASQSASGVSYFLGDSGGYLLGFALAATILGLLARRGWDRTPAMTAAAMAIGNAAIYFPGLLWLGLRHGFDAPILEWGLYPFLVGDIAKICLAMTVFPIAWRTVKRATGKV
ncbi:MAG: biotin transporter BioY [Parvularculaceae bacterium]|nr:biotin transporter BioY [Parvularculaceae bacterium]